MPGETPPQTSKITNDHFRPLQVEDLTHLEKNQQVPKNEGYRGPAQSHDKQQVLRPPPNRPSQDNQGQVNSGGSRVQSQVDEFTTLISNSRFGAMVQQGDSPQYIQITPTITAFLEQMKEERRLDCS
ncbi:hypothetical protein Tco_0434408 [Tanacetum coccineum]